MLVAWSAAWRSSWATTSASSQVETSVKFGFTSSVRLAGRYAAKARRAISGEL